MCEYRTPLPNEDNFDPLGHLPMGVPFRNDWPTWSSGWGTTREYGYSVQPSPFKPLTRDELLAKVREMEADGLFLKHVMPRMEMEPLNTPYSWANAPARAMEVQYELQAGDREKLQTQLRSMYPAVKKFDCAFPLRDIQLQDYADIILNKGTSLLSQGPAWYEPTTPPRPQLRMD